MDNLTVTSGPATTFRARYIVGADGANSAVRNFCNMEVTDLGWDYDWLVVDLLLKESQKEWPYELSRLGPMQLCDPARPSTVAVGESTPHTNVNGSSHVRKGGPGRKRLEFMKLPTETREELKDPEHIWKLCKVWDCTPVS